MSWRAPSSSPLGNGRTQDLFAGRVRRARRGAGARTATRRRPRRPAWRAAARSVGRRRRASPASVRCVLRWRARWRRRAARRACARTRSPARTRRRSARADRLGSAVSRTLRAVPRPGNGVAAIGLAVRAPGRRALRGHDVGGVRVPAAAHPDVERLRRRSSGLTTGWDGVDGEALAGVHGARVTEGEVSD